MHDRIFTNVRKIKRPSLEAHAKALGLDMVKFKKALDKGTYKAQVDADLKSGRQVGVRGTPTIFVNGHKAKKPTFDGLKPLLDEQLKKAEALLKSGTPLDKLYGTIVSKGKTSKADKPRRKRPPDKTVWKVKLDPSQDAIKGPKYAALTVVEYSDFQ